MGARLACLVTPLPGPLVQASRAALSEPAGLASQLSASLASAQQLSASLSQGHQQLLRAQSIAGTGAHRWAGGGPPGGEDAGVDGWGAVRSACSFAARTCMLCRRLLSRALLCALSAGAALPQF